MTKLFQNRSAWIQLLLIVVIALVYGRGLSGTYLQWDDNVFILENNLLDLNFWDFLKSVFSKFFFGDYLPLTLLSYWLEVQAFGRSPEVQHLTNLLIHSANVLLVHRLLKLWQVEEAPRFWIAMVFAIHPAQTEVVLWISERKSLLAVFWSLLALNFHEEFSDSKRAWKVSLVLSVLFVLSLLSKATALLLPVLLIVRSLWVQPRSSWQTFWQKYSLLFLIASLYTSLRIQAYAQSVTGFSETTWSPQRWLELPAQIFAAVGFYLFKFIFPFHQSIIYPRFLSAADWKLEILLALSFGFGLFVWLWRKREPQIWTFSLLIFLFLLPVLQLVPRINFVSDRYLYFPLIGMAGLLTCWKPKMFQSKWMLMPLVVLAMLSFERSEIWLSNEKLWRATTQSAPQSGLAQSNLALELLNQKKYSEAHEKFLTAVELGKAEGTSHLAYHNLGVIASTPGAGSNFDLKKSEEYFLASIREAPSDSYLSQFNLALLYLQKGEQVLARRWLEGLLSQLENSMDNRYQFLKEHVKSLLEKLKN